MRTFKLLVHPKSFSEEEVLITQRDAQTLKIGDLLEIYSPEDDSNHLLLKISSFSEVKDFQQTKDKPAISIEQSIAATFQFRTYCDIIVKKVDPLTVVLDSVELTFKDQYISRSDMWRFKQHMIGSCVFLNKKIKYIDIRTQVFEMWSQGERVSCGYISEDTKIVLRSAASMVYLFIQMSREMWDYDINGDLYYEKAINGFLFDLFNKWKRFNCTHDVTIVLFSRTFYDAKHIDEFPAHMHNCLQQDCKNRFYEDFYHVALQNERVDNWDPILISLKKLFIQYEEEVIRYHEKDNVRMPKATISTSSQGNFLEVLNMSLNVFEQHYLDRSFDRTGQLSVVISPGVGVFEVDFELNNITKQRIIDNGIGSDLVCLGEQPLHAVPLFKFNRGQSFSTSMNSADLYNMPHWINLSFYSSSNNHFCSSYVPRIKLPNIKKPKKDQSSWANKSNLYERKLNENETNSASICSSISLIDYDEHDEHIFKPPSTNLAANYTCQPSSRRKSTMTSKFQLRNLANERTNQRRLSDIFSTDLESSHESSLLFSSRKSSALPIPISNTSQTAFIHKPLSTSVENKSSKDFKPKLESKDDLVVNGYISTSGRSYPTQPKALINPFDPSHVTIKLTSNRRRWTHVFPLGPTGIFMQQHHYQAVPQNTACTLLPATVCINRKSACRATNSENFDNYESYILRSSKLRHSECNSAQINKSFDMINENTTLSEFTRRQDNRSASLILLADPHTDKSLSWAWGATGEQEWTPAITTGVDWKSLVIPACLPVTTDFYPDNRSLINDYVESEYSLLPDVQSPNFDQNDNLASQVFQELICQRLQQGFQIILFPKEGALSSNILSPTNDKYDKTLSIGRIFHRLKLDNSILNIKTYRPRHPYPTTKIHYCYRFRGQDNNTYGVSWADFISERLENYNWNHLDNYICTKGEPEFSLKPGLKYWRVRILLLPRKEAITRRIIENFLISHSPDYACESYTMLDLEERLQLQDGLLRFAEIINKIRKNRSKQKSILLNLHRIQDIKRLYSSQKENKHSSPIENDKLRLKGSKNRDDVDGNILTVASADFDSANVEETFEPKKLSSNTPIRVILDYLKNSNITFFGKEERLPNHTFISAEAVAWAIESIEGITSEDQGVEMFQELIKKRVICHASGSFDVQFEFGFFLFFIIDHTNLWVKDEPDLYNFQKKWFEIECLNSKPNSDYYDSEKTPTCNKRLSFHFKEAVIDLDSNGKNGRVEWIHVKYQNAYNPEYSYEMEIQWMVATSNQISDIVQGWSRKAGLHGLHLVPIPNDPFALPMSGNADPLRGPIFVNVDLDSLPPEAKSYLQGSGNHLIHFRETILERFGFLKFNDVLNEVRRQFVHVSGTIFVVLPDTAITCDKTQKDQSKPEDICSPHEEYITRHFSRAKGFKRDGLEEIETGYLWAWNFMITKRWKNGLVGDEIYMRRFLHNFRRFCLNCENRLSIFWKQYQEEFFSKSNC